MWKIGIICLLLYGLWLLGYTLYEKLRPKRKKTPLKNSERELTTEQILGKSRFRVSHSKPEVSTYPETENATKNAPIFDSENKNKPSGDPLGEGQETDDSEEPDMNDFPAEFEEQDDVTLNLGEEEEVESLSARGKVEYAGGVDVLSMLSAYTILRKEDATTKERQQAAEVLHLIRGTDIMECLRSEPKRAAKIDELINERFAELPKAIRQTDESETPPADRGTDGFNMLDYLPRKKQSDEKN